MWQSYIQKCKQEVWNFSEVSMPTFYVQDRLKLASSCDKPDNVWPWRAARTFLHSALQISTSSVLFGSQSNFSMITISWRQVYSRLCVKCCLPMHLRFLKKVRVPCQVSKWTPMMDPWPNRDEKLTLSPLWCNNPKDRQSIRYKQYWKIINNMVLDVVLCSVCEDCT